jgi:hypothetical protein
MRVTPERAMALSMQMRKVEFERHEMIDPEDDDRWFEWRIAR